MSRILEARKKLILTMFEHIRHQLIEWFDERRTLEDKMTGLLVGKAAEQLQIATNERARWYPCHQIRPGCPIRS
jgi:hypothetical protein